VSNIGEKVLVLRRSVASIPIPCGRSLRPVKNRRERFVKSVCRSLPYFSLLGIYNLNKETGGLKPESGRGELETDLGG